MSKFGSYPPAALRLLLVLRLDARGGSLGDRIALGIRRRLRLAWLEVRGEYGVDQRY